MKFFSVSFSRHPYRKPRSWLSLTMKYTVRLSIIPLIYATFAVSYNQNYPEGDL